MEAPTEFGKKKMRQLSLVLFLVKEVRWLSGYPILIPRLAARILYRLADLFLGIAQSLNECLKQLSSLSKSISLSEIEFWT